MTNHHETVEEIKARVQDMLLDTGFAIHYVEGETPYGYTVGRTLHGRPELLISGLPRESTTRFLINAIELDAAEPIEAARPARAIFGESHLAFPIAVDPWGAEMHLAIASFGIITALQLLWPDDAGRFPGDPDYAHDVALQRVFL